MGSKVRILASSLPGPKQELQVLGTLERAEFGVLIWISGGAK
jgi:hypothetical protein